MLFQSGQLGSPLLPPFDQKISHFHRLKFLSLINQLKQKIINRLTIVLSILVDLLNI